MSGVTLTRVKPGCQQSRGLWRLGSRGGGGGGFVFCVFWFPEAAGVPQLAVKSVPLGSAATAGTWPFLPVSDFPLTRTLLIKCGVHPGEPGVPLPQTLTQSHPQSVFCRGRQHPQVADAGTWSLWESLIPQPNRRTLVGTVFPPTPGWGVAAECRGRMGAGPGAG